MTVEVAGSVMPSRNEAPLQRNQGSVPATKVIDAEQIKSILYLGIRGELKLPFEQKQTGLAAGRAEYVGHGVDTFA